MNLTIANDSMNSTDELVDPFQPPSIIHQVTIIVVYSIMLLFSLSGNTIIIFIVFTRPFMRSVTNCLIANMAAADLLMTFSAMPYSVAYTYVASRWFGGIMGMITCKLLHFSIALSIAASILTLTVIALDRFFAVAYPFKRVSVIRHIPRTNMLIWLVSVLCMSPYLYYYKSDLLEDNNYHCFLLWEPLANSFTALRIYFSFIFIALYLVPLIVICIFYSIISFKLWARRIPGNPTEVSLRNEELSKRRTIKILIIIVVVFALCWLPAHLMHFFIFFEDKTFNNLSLIIIFGISHANSAINPYLNIVLNRNFRRPFLEVLRSCFGPAGNLRSRGSHTTPNTVLARCMSQEYVVEDTALGRRELYELSNKTEQNGDLPIIRQISLLEVRETEVVVDPASNVEKRATVSPWQDKESSVAEARESTTIS
ncbi:QRFP-like peptide receptor [Porites lutea]|uniref:QRFP-like peptide receptor n=1 Tax=Porites lutea TaxID=51062 RepID=UPI003CC633AA